MTRERIEEGNEDSVMLILEGSQEWCKRIEDLFKEGKLTEILGISVEDVQLESAIPAENFANTSQRQTSQRLVNLSQWLENVFTEGWKTIEDLFGQKEANLAFALRIREVEPENSDMIKNLIQLLYTSPDEHRRQQAAQRLRDSGTRNSEAIAALIHLLHTTEDEETRWTAAESLWMLDPGNPVAGVRRVTDLSMRLAGHAVVLMVAVLEQAEQTVDILVRVYPMGSKTYLPAELQLTVLDEFDKTFLEAQAREDDNYIQLKFGGSRKERFSVRVTLGNAGITEDFLI